MASTCPFDLFQGIRIFSNIDKIVSAVRGPGQYQPVRPQMGGGRFNMSNAKSDLDWIVYRAAQIPGPGQYDAAKSLDTLTKTPSCRLLGRTGPKTLPWPYGGQRHETLHSPDSSAMVSTERKRDGSTEFLFGARCVVCRFEHFCCTASCGEGI